MYDCTGTHEHFISFFLFLLNPWIFLVFISVAPAERILLDCHDIVAVAGFVVLGLPPDASQPNDDDVAVVADDQALYQSAKNR